MFVMILIIYHKYINILNIYLVKVISQVKNNRYLVE